MGLRAPRLAAALLLLASLAGCLGEDKVAGGSSGVDNPQVVVALVDTNGAPVAFTGSLSLFLADQNPALDPDPLVEIQLVGDSVVHLNPEQFVRPGGSRFNLLLRGGSGMGVLVDSVAYDSAAGKVIVDGVSGTRILARLVPLRNYSASVSLDVNGPERVFVPGTPYQSVVVADSFAFAGIPEGVFPLRSFSSEGVEREFQKPLDTREPDHFTLDTAMPPIERPPYSGPDFSVSAGSDQSVYAGAAVSLSGKLTGIAADDHRTAILWRQIFATPQDPWAYIETPTTLNTRVDFMWPGVYRFVLSISVGGKKVEDTVTVGVQAARPQFFDPADSEAVAVGYPSNVKWFAYGVDTLDVQFSRDSGATWQTVLDDAISAYGFNVRQWLPTGPTSDNCFLRLVDSDGATVASSARFRLVDAWFTGPGHYDN
jgi:hypothetical protein